MFRGAVKLTAGALTLFALAACEGDSSLTQPGVIAATLADVPTDGNEHKPIPGSVKICRFGGPGTFSTSQVPAGGGTSIEANSDMTVTECSITWLSNGAPGPYNVTVSQTGPAGFRISRLAVFHTNADLDQNYEDPAGCAGNMDIQTSATTVVGGDAGAVFWFKECPPAPPPPPPSDCNGLTPGFWKNWANHYTAAQFALIIDGTAFPNLTNQQATSILSANNPAYNRLYKFVLANQLTMSLTNLPNLPNPSGGSMSGSCTVNGQDMSDAMALALAMLANPANYSNGQLNAMGTLMDQFANMND